MDILDRPLIIKHILNEKKFVYQEFDYINAEIRVYDGEEYWITKIIVPEIIFNVIKKINAFTLGYCSKIYHIDEKKDFKNWRFTLKSCRSFKRFKIKNDIFIKAIIKIYDEQSKQENTIIVSLPEDSYNSLDIEMEYTLDIFTTIQSENYFD